MENMGCLEPMPSARLKNHKLKTPRFLREGFLPQVSFNLNDDDA